MVQTVARVIERCLLMTTDPGDLVLDPTCGSGTTAYVAEQWGRRWITCDSSRVALAAVSISGPIERLSRQPGRLHAATVVAGANKLTEVLRRSHAGVGR